MSSASHSDGQAWPLSDTNRGLNGLSTDGPITSASEPLADEDETPGSPLARGEAELPSTPLAGTPVALEEDEYDFEQRRPSTPMARGLLSAPIDFTDDEDEDEGGGGGGGDGDDDGGGGGSGGSAAHGEVADDAAGGATEAEAEAGEAGESAEAEAAGAWPRGGAAESETDVAAYGSATLGDAVAETQAMVGAPPVLDDDVPIDTGAGVAPPVARPPPPPSAQPAGRRPRFAAPRVAPVVPRARFIAPRKQPAPSADAPVALSGGPRTQTKRKGRVLESAGSDESELGAAGVLAGISSDASARGGLDGIVSSEQSQSARASGGSAEYFEVELDDLPVEQAGSAARGVGAAEAAGDGSAEGSAGGSRGGKSKKRKDRAPPAERDAPKAKAPKDPNAPKKARSAYMLWSLAERQTATYDGLALGEAMKMLGAAWKALDDEAKAPWIEEARHDKAR